MMGYHLTSVMLTQTYDSDEQNQGIRQTATISCSDRI